MLTMSRRSRTARLMVTYLVGGLLAYHFGARALLAWLGMNALLEVWLLVIQARFKPRPVGFTAVIEPLEEEPPK